MNKKIKQIINILLLISILSLGSIYILIHNINKGLTEKDIKEFVDKIDITKELRKTEIYDEIRTKVNINKDTIEKILNSDQIERYIKDNITDICISVINDQNLPIINNKDIIDIVETNVDKLMKEKNIELTEEQKQKLLELTNQYASLIEEGMNNLETFKREITIFKNFTLKTVPKILLFVTIMTMFFTVIYNRTTHEYLIYIGIPCVLIGIFNIIAFITINGLTSLFKTYQNLTLKTGVIGLIIGIIQIIIYAKIGRKSDENGEDRLIQI